MHSVLPAYAELHALSNFSFQRGASHPEELVERAHALGYTALALTDECSVAGVVRAHVAAKALGLKYLPGAEFRVHTGPGQSDLGLVVLPHDAAGWGNLCEFISTAREAGQGTARGYRVALGQARFESLAHCELLLCPLPDDALDEAAWRSHLRWAQALWVGRVWLAVELVQRLDDVWRLHTLQRLGDDAGMPRVAAGGVLMHVRSRKPLHDVMTAVALGCTVHDCGRTLQANAQAHLRPRMALADAYPPDLLASTLTVASRCHFSLDEIRSLYRYPQQDIVPPGHSPAQWLAQLTQAGARERYPQGVPVAVQRQIAHELALIEELHYEMYFLTVHDIVQHARSQDILCQGRGSAANSAVCFCLGITAIDPAESQVLFERFISRERQEPPDIDVDFEHQRREEVIQYIYAKYGRDRAAIAATVIRYRPRSALRDVGKALGLAPELIDHFAKDHFWFDGPEVLAGKLAQAGLDPLDAAIGQWLELSSQLLGMPRHLSQHVGGFVLTEGQLTRLVPVQPASMEARHIIQWDKDDLDAVGLMKVDVLALGMLSAIRGCLQLLNQWHGTDLQMHQIPPDDAPTYDMICAADTVGVFQVESRAQVSMLPRLKPRCYYDLVVQVAIVRPGPIQGGMVHPYLQRRQMQRRPSAVARDALTPALSQGEREPDQAQKGQAQAGPSSVSTLSQGERGPELQGVGEYPALEPALGRTLGVPIFQEQVMQVAMIAADFTPGEADQLRRAMAAWKRKGGLDKFHQRLVGRMVEKGYAPDFAERIFTQIQGFGEYGFPESHAASFAKLVYVSCWLKKHEPACFLAAMLNAQPLGFYSPSQLVQDARRHGVEVRAVDVLQSGWDCTLEEADRPEGRAPTQPKPCAFVGAQPPGRSSHAVGAQPPERTVAAVGAQPPGRFPAVRLGLCLVAGLSQVAAGRILAAREAQVFASIEDLALRADLSRRDLDALAAADALTALAGHRRQQVWQAAALRRAPGLLKSAPVNEAPLALPPMSEGEALVFDHQALGLTLGRHPLALLRPRLAARGLRTWAQLQQLPGGRIVAACGIVTVRQQPATAKGVMFVSLEDESGTVNVIVGRALRERQREAVLQSRLLAVWGHWERNPDPDLAPGWGPVCHLVARRVQDLSALLGRLARSSRDFH